MKFKGMKQAGFSLVELMVVVGIIGILAAIAVPKLQQFTAKAKQSEAKSALKNLDTLQQSYFAENSVYGSFATVGFSMTNTKSYTVTDGFNSGSANLYSGTATAKNKLCSSASNTDVWTINESGTLSQTAEQNGLTGC